MILQTAGGGLCRPVHSIRDGCGRGHGSPALRAIHRIAELISTGELKNVRAVPCSPQVERDTRRPGIPLTTLNAHPVIDVIIAGADEVTDTCELIKGGAVRC